MFSRCLKYGTALHSKKWNSHKALSLDRALYLRLGHTKVLHWSHFLWFKNIKPPVQMKLQPDFKIIQFTYAIISWLVYLGPKGCIEYLDKRGGAADHPFAGGRPSEILARLPRPVLM